MKRIVFISCRCTSKSMETSDEEEEIDETMSLDQPQAPWASNGNKPVNTMIG